MIEVVKYENTGAHRPFKNGDYYYAPVVDGEQQHQVAETPDMAFLIGIGIKYDGLNSQFPKMAARMLNIESEWAK